MYVFSPQYLAQVRNPALTGGFQSFRGYGFFNEIMPSIVLLALIIGVTYFLFVLITGAIAWISSGGDKQKVEDARKRIASAITGLLILLFIFAITQLMNVLLGIDIGNLGP